MTQIYETDVAVIGAGPVGVFSVFACGMLGLRCHVVDALDEIGGQCTALYPEKPIYDIPAWPEISAGDLIARLEEQAAPFQPVYHLGQHAVSLSDIDSKKRLLTSRGDEIVAGAVIIAAGAGAFGPNRPPLAGLSDYEGKSVFYMVRRKNDFAGKKIVIAGGGDSAVDWALSLSEVAATLYVVHRRDKFRAAPDNVEKMRALDRDGVLELVVPAQLKGLEGANGRLSGVIVEDMDGAERTLEADILLPFYGLAADAGPLADWDLGLEHHRIPVDMASCATRRTGIYAVGDIVSYKNKLKLISSGFAEASQAAHAIYAYLHDGAEAHFEYSTSKGVPETR